MQLKRNFSGKSTFEQIPDGVYNAAMIDNYDQLREIERTGWKFHQQQRDYHCGHCGTKVSTILGLWRNAEVRGREAQFEVRLCTHCYEATNLIIQYNDIVYQNPMPRYGKKFTPPQGNDDLSQIIGLYIEAQSALSQGCPSCAVLMFRKLLMHIAVEKKANVGLRFIEYCDYLKDNNIVSEPQFGMVDRIKNDGNAENHEIRKATNKEAQDLIKLVTMLIESIYFMK